MNNISFRRIFMYPITIAFFVGVIYSAFFNPKTRLINKPVVADSAQVIVDTTKAVIDSVKVK